MRSFGFNIFKKNTLSAPFGLPASSNIAYGQIQIQPCVINKQPFIIYPKGLQETSPALFHKLCLHYNKKGYGLKEDQRDYSKQRPPHKERRRWVPVVLFTASLLFDQGVHAEVDSTTAPVDSAQTNKIVLRIVPKQRTHLDFDKQLKELETDNNQTEVKLTSFTAKYVFSILRSHYTPQDSDPGYIINDLKQIANYYGRFPEVVNLLTPLRGKNWSLQYDEDNWDTIANGNSFEVDKAVIHFNTRAAAQLLLNRKCKDNPVCIASPADALLHELLHTYSMFIDTAKFMRQGGMNSVMYPFQHEYAIIDAERKLYASMSVRDDLKRPQRTEHTGRTVIAHCPLCIK